MRVRSTQGHLAIFDLQGSTVSKTRNGWGLITEINRIGQDYYPELMGTICVINAPPAVSWAVGAVKALIHPDTAAKIETSSGDPVEVPPRPRLPAPPLPFR